MTRELYYRDHPDERTPDILSDLVKAQLAADAAPPQIRHIGVVGLGPLGHGLAAVLRYAGRHSVIGWDPHPEVVGQHPMDSELRELLADGPVPQAPSLEALLDHADLIFLTPATKTVDSNIQWYLRRLVDEMLESIRTRPADRRYLLINSCPVRPGTTRELMSASQRPPSVDVGYHPIRATLENLGLDLQNPDSLFLGADTRQMLAAFEQVWRPIVNTVPTHYVTIGEAEVIGHHYYRVNGWRVDA